MAIASIFKKLQTDKAEIKKFLALELTEEVVQAAVWQVQDGKTELVTIGPPVEWQGPNNSEVELLSAIDATISGATEGLSPEPTEVVLGLTPEWTKDGVVEKDKRQLIRKIFTELELKALGFVTILDSVIFHLKLTEGTPPTALFIQVFKHSLVTSLVQLGKVVSSTICTRSESISTDIDSALTKLQSDTPLPTRILLFNSMHDLEELAGELTAHNWSSEHNFLHVPTCSALPRDIAIRAVASAGGAEVTKTLGDPSPTPTSASTDVSPGFVSTAPVSTLPFASAADLGFSTGSAPSQELFSPPSPPSPPHPSSLPPARHLPKLTLPPLHLPKLPPLPSFHLSLGRAKVLWLIPLSLLLLFVTYASLLWFVPQALIQVVVTPKPINESLTFTLVGGTNSSSLTLDNVVPGTSVEQASQKEATIETTGEKIIGDKAKGEVVIYNRTSLPKTFAAGTLLSAHGLKFALDEGVTVASKSAGSDYVDVPGKATAKITANLIGTESNLAAGTEFTLASFSKDTYVAKNDAAITGGTSSTVRVVQEEDKSKLLAGLKSDLLQSVKGELEQGLSPDEGFYLASGSAAFTTTSMSAEVGTEADVLTATLSLKAVAIKYRLSDVEALVAKVITSSIPPGFVRAPTPPTVQINSGTTQDDGTVQVQAGVTVSLVPELDISSLEALVRGKTVSELAPLLSSIPGYSTFTAKFTPQWLPPRWSRLPRNPHNIRFVISPLAN